MNKFKLATMLDQAGFVMDDHVTDILNMAVYRMHTYNQSDHVQ